ncbi:hypothetical protein, partial [Sinorhizobium meliloti]
THRDLQVSGELQESICRNKTTAYLLNAIPLPLVGEMAGRPEGVERKTLHAAEDEFAARIPCGIPKMRSYDFVM